jgi:hypothetical protein
MTHKSEFTNATAAKDARAELAAAYHETFSSPHGKTVLDDLRQKFGLDRRRFDPRSHNPSAIAAAIIEGECNVLRDIEAALKYGDK